MAHFAAWRPAALRNVGLTRAAQRRALAGIAQKAQGKRGVAIRNARTEAGAVQVAWDDGHESAFLPVWLQDHNPATIHPTSAQRQLDSASVDLDAPVPGQVAVEEDGAKLRLRWEGSADDIVFDSVWLREHCYDDKARRERALAVAGTRTLWSSAELPKEKVHRLTAAELQSSDEALAACLAALLDTGVAIVTGMPSTIEETEVVVRRIGPPRATFYGAMWDTAPKAEQEINDTAYTKDGLHPHTDTSYLIDSAGLQLFNCVAQSESSSGLNHEGEPEGATKLVDGYRVLHDLRANDPDAFQFFVETPLKWHCIEKGVFVRTWEPVISFDPATETVRQFRYNSYDLSPVDYLPADKMHDYYRHTRTLNAYLRSPEYISYMRMNVGEMVIIDNHRVFHGRTAFSGFRNMVGCYIGRDDWLSTYRSVSGVTDLINDV